ncbi:hypothetical protein C8Q80DRAFT_1114292 [Daedaleopsis nitida]|nr:hypothetical protein C8Q80DRAFT_1114292 [Daedaleopsis nitida]
MAFAALAPYWGIPVAASTAKSLQVTALVGRDMKSTVECSTDRISVTMQQQMKVQQLGDLAKATYVEISAEADHKQGPYNAPNIQFFTILEGNATITFPESTEVLYIKPGQLYIAADDASTSELGHLTAVRAGSRLLQFPFKDGIVPAHGATAGGCGSGLHGVRDEL